MAAMEKNDKTLKSSSEREQNQLAGSAEREKIKGSQNLNVPNLRFPEFSGEWEKCTLGDITTNFSLRNKEQIQYPMFSVTNNRGFVPQSEQFEDREMIGEDIKAYKIIHEGDFAYNPARINVGSIAKYGKTEPCMISSLYVCFKAHSNIDTEWMMQLLKTPKMNFYYNVNGEGGVRVYLFYPNFARIRTSYPSLVEQQKIAAFLRLLDQRIETQKKIIEKYESLIRGLYHSSFNHSENVTIKLSDIVTILKGKQVNGENLLENGQYYVMNGGVEPSGYLNEYNTPADIISISEGGNSCGYVQYNKEPFWSGGHCYSLIPKENNICYRFLYHFLKYKENDIMALRIGSGLPNIQKKDLERFEVCIPSLEQQKHITTLLDTISAKYDLERQLQYIWQSQKYYMLCSLFI